MWATSARCLPAASGAAAGDRHPMNASEPRNSGLPPIFAVTFAALIGAVAVAGFLRLPEFMVRAVLGSESLQVEVTRTFHAMLGDAFSTRWGAIGALAGVAVGWGRFRRRRTTPPGDDGEASWNPAGTLAEPPRRVPAGGRRDGPVLLAWGLALLLASFGVFPSVMLWMLALWTLPPAVLLLVIGAIRIRDSSTAWPRKLAGLALLLAGMAALGAAALIGTYISYRLSLPAYHLSHQIQRPPEPLPDAADWVRFIGGSLFAALFTSVGLRLWTDWPASRRIRWCAIILLFPLAALLLHRVLVAAGILQLSA